MSRLELMLLLPLAALCVPASAQQPEAQGAVVVRDAQTGQLRPPTAAEMRALAPPPAAAASSMAPPAIVTGPGGRRSVRLDERHMVHSVTTRDDAGGHSEHCVKGAHAAGQIVNQPAPAAKPQEGRHETR
jgi:hypothetical protein